MELDPCVRTRPSRSHVPPFPSARKLLAGARRRLLGELAPGRRDARRLLSAETGARSSQLSAMGNGHGHYLVPWFENRSAWTEAMAGARGIEQTTWNSINHAKKRPERVQMRECIPAVCLCSACSQLQRPASSRHSHMLEKSLGLLSLLLVLINARRRDMTKEPPCLKSTREERECKGVPRKCKREV